MQSNDNSFFCFVGDHYLKYSEVDNNKMCELKLVSPDLIINTES